MGTYIFYGIGYDIMMELVPMFGLLCFELPCWSGAGFRGPDKLSCVGLWWSEPTWSVLTMLDVVLPGQFLKRDQSLKSQPQIVFFS